MPEDDQVGVCFYFQLDRNFYFQTICLVPIFLHSVKIIISMIITAQNYHNLIIGIIYPIILSKTKNINCITTWAL